MKKIGKYEILEQIGQGAMGIVYKALDPFIERIVAVKTIAADLDADPELRTRFFREARSAGQLSHKNIVTIYDLGEEGGKAYMAMEFLDGEDVKQRIARGGRIPLEHRLQYMIEVTEGLAHAHKRGVFHRDIKPGNIYITNTGQVKILDFGLARIASSDMTKSGSVMGTPNYMSPEQIRGNQVDNRSDIFSAGATFYELLTYRKPFHSESLQSTFFKILQEDPEPIETIDPSIPPEFSTVLLRAMAKEPGDRYQNAEEMVQALERLEKTLEQHKRRAKEEAKEAVELLDRLVAENTQVLGGEKLQSELRELWARTSSAAAGDQDEDGGTKPNLESGFLEILEIRDTARREHQRLEVLLQKRQAAASLLGEAASLELEGQLDKALELAEKVVADLPEHAEALAFSRRVRKTLSDRAQEEARDAVEKLQLLIAENGDLLEGEDHFNPSDLKAAIVLASISGQSNDQDATILMAPSQGNAEILQIRDKARDEHERLEAVISARRRIRVRVQEAAIHEQAGKFEEALRLAQEILHEVPTHREAHALVNRVRETLSTRAQDEARKRQLARLLHQSRQLHNQKKLSESLHNLEEALALDPQNPDALALHRQVSAEIEEEKRKQEQALEAADLFQTASTQFSGDDLSGARKSLAEALALDPNHAGAADLLAEVERGIQEQAELEEKKGKAQAAVISARKSFDAGDLGRARQEVERALSIDPEGSAAIETLGKIVQAEEELWSLQERQRQLQSLLQEALSLFESGDDAGAAAKVAALLKLEPQHVSGLELNKRIVGRREARERAATEKKERIAKALTQAREAQGSGDLKKAVELINSVLKEEAAHPEAGELLKGVEELRARKERQELERRVKDLLARSDEFVKRGDYQGAISLLEKAEPEIASMDSVKKSLGRHREAARVEGEARERAEREKRERITKTLSEARKAQSAGEFEKARGLARALLAEDPTHREAGELLKGLEDAIETRRQREEAEKAGRELLSQAEKLASRGSYREAISILEGAKPMVASLPSVKQGIEQYRKAAQAQEEARARAQRVQDHMGRGKKSFEHGDYAACEREMDQILVLEPSNSDASDYRAQARGQLQKQRDEELRLKELSGSIRAAEQNLKAGQLEAARSHVQRAKALDSNSADAARLQAQIEQRETELREEQARKQRSQELAAEARSALETGEPDRAEALLAEAMLLGTELSGAAALQKRIEKQKRRLSKAQQAGATTAPGTVLAHKAGMPRTAIWLGILILIGVGLLVWALLPGGPQYEQQIASAKSYLEQKQFGKAMETLQQIPSSSPLYGQAQGLITEARNGEKQKNIDVLVAEATDLRKQGQNDKSLAAAEKVLELDASNQPAKSIRDEIERESYQSKTRGQQDQYVNATLARAQELFNGGNLEAAKGKTDEVILVRPDDPKAANLKRRIQSQVEAISKVNAERSKWEQAKASAERARAPELAQARFAAGQSAEQMALRQQNAKQLDEAAKKFSEAAVLYGESEKEARAESQTRAEQGQRTAALQLQRSQAETARGGYDQSRTKARDAEAETKASDRFQAAVRMASDAQAKFDRGDFAGARGEFDAASTAMLQAQDAAARATQAAQATQAQAAQTQAAQATQATQAEADRTRTAREAAQREENERQAIRSVLDRYKAAYEKRDVPALRAVFPTVAVEANNIGLAKSIQLDLAVGEIQISGETAKVTSQFQLTMVTTTDNRTQKPPKATVVFNLRKGNNGSWIIQSTSR